MQLLLTLSADLNQVLSDGLHSRHNAIRPLSAAILKNKPLVVEILAEKGAQFGGRGILPPAHEPIHFPIFAAAKATGTTLNNGHEMTKLCVEKTSDINGLIYQSIQLSSY